MPNKPKSKKLKARDKDWYICFIGDDNKIMIVKRDINNPYNIWPESWQCFPTRKQAQVACSNLRKALKEARVIR